MNKVKINILQGSREANISYQALGIPSTSFMNKLGDTSCQISPYADNNGQSKHEKNRVYVTQISGPD